MYLSSWMNLLLLFVLNFVHIYQILKYERRWEWRNTESFEGIPTAVSVARSRQNSQCPSLQSKNGLSTRNKIPYIRWDSTRAKYTVRNSSGVIEKDNVLRAKILWLFLTSWLSTWELHVSAESKWTPRNLTEPSPRYKGVIIILFVLLLFILRPFAVNHSTSFSRVEYDCSSNVWVIDALMSYHQQTM